MEKVLIICEAGMSALLIAKKATKFLIGKWQDILVDAVSTTEENKMIEFSDFSLFLISSQIKIVLFKIYWIR